MKPRITIENDAGLQTLFYVDNAILSKMILGPDDLTKMLAKVIKCASLVGVNAFKPLPIGEELYGRWLVESPSGREFENPPIAWEFENRMDTAKNSPYHHILLIGAESVNEVEFKIELEDLFGENFVSGIDYYQTISQLQYLLDTI